MRENFPSGGTRPDQSRFTIREFTIKHGGFPCLHGRGPLDAKAPISGSSATGSKINREFV
jgi:hypothetical protein